MTSQQTIHEEWCDSDEAEARDASHGDRQPFAPTEKKASPTKKNKKDASELPSVSQEMLPSFKEADESDRRPRIDCSAIAENGSRRGARSAIERRDWRRVTLHADHSPRHAESARESGGSHAPGTHPATPTHSPCQAGNTASYSPRQEANTASNSPCQAGNTASNSPRQEANSASNSPRQEANSASNSPRNTNNSTNHSPRHMSKNSPPHTDNSTNHSPRHTASNSPRHTISNSPRHTTSNSPPHTANHSPPHTANHSPCPHTHSQDSCCYTDHTSSYHSPSRHGGNSTQASARYTPNTSVSMYNSPSADLSLGSKSIEEQVVPGTPNGRHTGDTSASGLRRSSPVRSDNEREAKNASSSSGSKMTEAIHTWSLNGNTPSTDVCTWSLGAGGSGRRSEKKLSDGPTMTVLYDFEATEEGDLSVRQGATITLLNDDDATWLWVRDVGNAEGYIPRDFAVEDGFSESGIEVPDVGEHFPSPSACLPAAAAVAAASPNPDSDTDGMAGTGKLSLSYTASSSSSSSLEQPTDERHKTTTTCDDGDVTAAADVPCFEESFVAMSTRAGARGCDDDDGCVPATPEGSAVAAGDHVVFDESPIEAPPLRRRDAVPQRSFQMYL
ncbi:PREDICTED: cell wall protein IFF6-like [Priapulus caudatus]|uniref:Cell wall protein IFF6-like n=1 Tax=Priapulus caudatus TaxID=37621 RepID=A0ABM1EYS8_PRICU|nr:PREDICTED: cell wall protein IFF6-like [Priapulus caudatus]